MNMMPNDSHWISATSIPLLVLENIFDHLEGDVLKAVLVCQDWKLILNDSRYWKKVILHIHI